LLERCLGRPRDEGQPLAIPAEFDGSPAALLEAARTALQQAETPQEAKTALDVLRACGELLALADAERRLRKLEEEQQ
jgi:hypothetical protein